MNSPTRNQTDTVALLRKLGYKIKFVKNPDYKAPKQSLRVIAVEPDLNLEMIGKLREIKSRFCLTTRDCVDLLKKKGVSLTRESLQQVLQGNISGSDRRTFDQKKNYKRNYRTGTNSDNESLFKAFLEIEKTLNESYSHLFDYSMQTVIDDWCKQLSLPIQNFYALADVIQVHNSTVFKWYRDNRTPSFLRMIDANERVKKAIVLKNK